LDGRSVESTSRLRARSRNDHSEHDEDLVGLAPVGSNGGDPFEYRRSSRRDIRSWGLLVVGLVFLLGAFTVDWGEGCSRSIECKSWMQPLAFALGGFASLAGLGLLVVNTSSGSRIDAESGELVWWHDRTRTHPGTEGRIQPADIGRVRIVVRDAGKNAVHLYDRDGRRQPDFDEEVLPIDVQRWAERLAERWPHIEIENSD
jgi:hypothetical protein